MPVIPFGPDDAPQRSSVEPELAFIVSAIDDTRVQLRVHFSQQCAPRWVADAQRFDQSFSVILDLTRTESVAAADA